MTEQPRREARPKIRQRGPEAPWRLAMGYPFLREWGDASRIAEACGQISPQAVSQWKGIPRQHLHAVSVILNIPAGVLRPDIGLVRLANGEPATLLELILAWRIVKAARATLGHATQAAKEARAEQARASAALHMATAQLARDKQAFRAELLVMQHRNIEHLRSYLKAAENRAEQADKARKAQYRSLIRSGIPQSFIQDGLSATEPQPLRRFRG
ncbi:MAG: hypothetical protein ABF791_05640 [Acetobacter sp.]|uniref:hypothetical protein n=1 Tax=Acetobacter sp. TaxID=440 RepID=UPI0039EA3986